ALVGREEAGDDVHERGLAGPVLAQEPEHLAGAERDIDPVVGENAWKPFGDAVEFEQRLHAADHRARPRQPDQTGRLTGPPRGTRPAAARRYRERTGCGRATRMRGAALADRRQIGDLAGLDVLDE